MPDRPSTSPEQHAQDFARRYAHDLDAYCAVRMQGLGIPEERQGADDLRPRMKWCAFDPEGTEGGTITSGVVVNSGVLNPELFQGAGSRVWAKARLRDRIDAVITHEWTEFVTGSHEMAIKESPKTELPITDGARKILKAMAR